MADIEMKEIVPVSAHAVIAEIYLSILSAESPDIVLVLAQAARMIAETAAVMEPLESNSVSISNGV
jgi:hypothetical protein